jgi:hypothetical protein
MLNHEEAIQELESQRGHREEIKGRDRFPLIGEKREPSGEIRVSIDTSQPSRVDLVKRGASIAP